MAKKGFRAVDIAHAGIEVLVHHERANAAPRFVHLGP